MGDFEFILKNFVDRSDKEAFEEIYTRNKIYEIEVSIAKPSTENKFPFLKRNIRKSTL